MGGHGSGGGEPQEESMAGYSTRAQARESAQVPPSVFSPVCPSAFPCVLVLCVDGVEELSINALHAGTEHQRRRPLPVQIRGNAGVRRPTNQPRQIPEYTEPLNGPEKAMQQLHAPCR